MLAFDGHEGVALVLAFELALAAARAGPRRAVRPGEGEAQRELRRAVGIRLPRRCLGAAEGRGLLFAVYDPVGDRTTVLAVEIAAPSRL